MAIKIVKSVARVLEILELFDEVQEPMPAVEIAERLNYPLASTHEILKTMVALGFFSYGTPKWTYKPSSRFPETVEWVKSNLPKNSNIYKLMDALSNETLETINLSQRMSSQVKIIKGLECRYEIGVSSKPGTVMEATLCLTGIVALAHLSEEDLEAFFISLKQNNTVGYKATNFDLVKSIHTELQETGYSMRTDVSVNGIGALCCPVISSEGEPYVMGIVGPSHRVKENKDRLVRALKKNVRRCSVDTKYKIKLR